MFTRRKVLKGAAWLAASSLSGAITDLVVNSPAKAQDAQEQLGAARGAFAGPHPLLEIESKHPASLKEELLGVHPRLFFTDAELSALRQRARTTHADIWQRAMQNLISTHEEPAPPPAQGRRDQNEVGLAIAEAAFVYQIERDPKYLQLARKFMDAAVSYDVWGYISSKPNVDLAAAHLLYGLGWGYDLLYHELNDSERDKYRSTVQRHANLLFDSYELNAHKAFSYSQNHLFIPAAGLGIAAYALYGEVPEAAHWARRVRALYDRVMATYSVDGYYYEGFEYWVFATPWIVHYLDALLHCTGEDLFDHPGLKNAHNYVAHSMLPDGNNVFDFGDVFSGPLTRSGKSPEIERTHPGGHLHSNYHLLYRFAQKYQSGEAKGVAEWLSSLGQTNFEDYWALAWYEPGVKAVPIDQQPTTHYFADNEVVFWRTAWNADATAFAFKCGPPEGHYVTKLIPKMPDWHLEEGHSHPDAASFILYGNHQYLSGASGYAGVPMTNQANTLLIDGHGQVREGEGHDAFRGVSYDRLNRIRILKVDARPGSIDIQGDATAAYGPQREVRSFIRSVNISKNKLVISDAVQLSAAHVPEILVHFDGDGIPKGLHIDVEEPPSAVQRLEPNDVTAPGPPGAVDKGPREVRGSRLVIATAKRVQQAEFRTVLTW